MEIEFEKALQGLLELNDSQSSQGKFGELFQQMIAASMQICSEKDYGALIQQKAELAEKKYRHKMDASENDSDLYKKLREVVRFEMAHESMSCGKEHEVCCTESNFVEAMGKIRAELEAIVPKGQMDVVQSMGQSLYSDFTQFFVCAVLDMVADVKIYQMKEFRPLQLNAMGKEVRTYVNVIRQQNAKPQKSKTVTHWFKTMMILPAFLFRKLYGVNFLEMFEDSLVQKDAASKMFENFERVFADFSSGDEYKILKDFLESLGLKDCFTVRLKIKKADKPLVN